MFVPTTGFGILLKHALGGTPSVVQQGGTTAYLQTHAFGSNAGMGLTVQKQIRTGANTLVERFTFIGTKILKTTFSIDTDGLLVASFDVNSKDSEVTTAAAALTYPTNTVFRYDQGSLSVGGVALAKVTSAEVSIERPQSINRRYLGSGGLQSQPVENARPTITGTLNCEFDTDIDAAIYDRFVSNSAAALALSFTGANISGIYNETFSLAVPEIHFEGETPKAGGEGEITLAAPFVGLWDGTNADIAISYTSTDTAV